MLEAADIVIQGLLLGGLYALFAIGLSITYGVMRLVNIAHGDFLVLAAYLALWPVTNLYTHPFLAILPVVVLMFWLGYVLQRFVLNRTMGPNFLAPMLATFGLSIILRNGLQQVYHSDSRSLDIGALGTESIHIGDYIAIGKFPLIVFVVAVILTLATSLLFSRTRIGAALRATSDDAETAGLMGIRAKHTYAIALGLSFALVAVGGVFAGIRTTFTPESGPASLLYAFEAVVIGGMGSLWGTFAGAVILGMAQGVGAKLGAGFGILAGHLVFLAVLAFKPTGLFERSR
ncbi:MAG: branched-chain amino acid ABC transporter permease [Hyphomicrobiales bacterium]|nr:branched-chain amino acid ABC transporter permease [Hyphomicrobiales bacterium]